MADDNGSAISVVEKELEKDALKRTVQQPPPGQGPFYHDAAATIFYVAQQADEIEPWGRSVKRRDAQLREFIPTESTFASALGSVSIRNAAFSWTLEGPEAAVDRYQTLLQNANFGRGWANLITQVSIDLYCQDSGAFIEIIRAGNSPDSEIVGLAHLDAARCYPTGIEEVPVVYQDRSGQYHWLKWFQVIPLTEMPATYESFPGLQYCALTRLLRAARILRDISIYLSEKVGGRHGRAVAFLKGVTADQVREAYMRTQIQNDSAGLLRFSMPMLVSSVSPDADVDFKIMELASIPDGFDLDLSFKQYIAQIALAFLSDYQEFAPLPGGNLGTSAQSEILHLKTRGKGPAIFMKLMSHAINWRVLPSNVEFKFDEQDAEEDKTVAEIKKSRAETRKIQLESGEITPEVSRMIAYDAGDLTQEQFELLQKQAEEEAEAEAEQSPPVVEQPEVLDDEGQPEAQETTPGEVAQEEGQKHLSGQHNQASHAGFPSFDTAEGFETAANVNDWNEALSPGEMASIRAYTSGSGYHGISGGLRKGKVAEKHQQSVDNLDSAVSKGTIEQNVTLYRGGYFDTTGVSPGNVFREDSFMSTSFSEKSANAFVPKSQKFSKHGVLMELRVPAGTNAAFLFKEPPKKTKFPDELEVILPRGVRFRVTEVIPKQGRTPKRLIADIIPPAVRKTLTRKTNELISDASLEKDGLGMLERWEIDGLPYEEVDGEKTLPRGRQAVEKKIETVIEDAFQEAWEDIQAIAGIEQTQEE